jgi:hypothetical protein
MNKHSDFKIVPIAILRDLNHDARHYSTPNFLRIFDTLEPSFLKHTDIWYRTKFSQPVNVQSNIAKSSPAPSLGDLFLTKKRNTSTAKLNLTQHYNSPQQPAPQKTVNGNSEPFPRNPWPSVSKIATHLASKA